MEEITNSDEMRYELDKLVTEYPVSLDEFIGYVARSIPLDLMQRVFSNIESQVKEDAHS